MRRSVVWVPALFLSAAAAVPMTAALSLPAATGSIGGTITNAVTGLELPMGASQVIAVDAFNTVTGARHQLWLHDDTDGLYTLPDLPAGDYKVRFRYWGNTGQLARYWWYGGGTRYDTADPVMVIAAALVDADAALPPFAGGTVAGQVTDAATGLPIPDGCFMVQIYEESGIGVGFFTDVVGGAWSSGLRVPAGTYTALAYSSAASCPGAPTHLDAWYGGTSGYPLANRNIVADAHTFGAAKMFEVSVGAVTPHIDLALLPAPTCRGKVPTIYGTTLADDITGTPIRDIISGLAGDDIIRGAGGNDLLCGDAGKDRLIGGAGAKDAADGGAGTDVCLGVETVWRCP